MFEIQRVLLCYCVQDDVTPRFLLLTRLKGDASTRGLFIMINPKQHKDKCLILQH